MNESICVKCGNSAELQCSRCPTKYCCRECQIAHWSIHKLTCKQEPRTKNIRLIESAHSRIAGNVCIYAAHYGFPVVVEITESIERFSEAVIASNSSGHFAHISLGIESANSLETPVIYKFSNFQHVLPLVTQPGLENRVKPPKLWSVWFEV